MCWVCCLIVGCLLFNLIFGLKYLVGCLCLDGFCRFVRFKIDLRLLWNCFKIDCVSGCLCCVRSVYLLNSCVILLFDFICVTINLLCCLLGLNLILIYA